MAAMDKLLVKFSAKRSRRNPVMPRPIALESSSLGGLPSEVIIHMARFLSTVSAASFTLCCSSIYEIIGTQYWQALLREDQKQQRAFLELLERDLPNHILCYHCNVLHLGNNRHCGRIRSPNERQDNIKIPECHIAEWDDEVPKHIHEDFRFGTFQMAMKQYRLGHDYNHWLSLLNFKSGPDMRKVRPTKCTAEARILGESLFLRKQQVVLFPSFQHVKDHIRSYDFKICPHLGTLGDHKIELSENIKCKLNHEHDFTRCVRHLELKQCSFCFTEYQIDIQGIGNYGAAVIATKWLDLGEGRSIMDPKWTCRLVKHVLRSSVLFGRIIQLCIPEPKSIEPVWFNPGSIYATFEQNEHPAFNPLLTQKEIQELSPPFCTIM